MILLLMIISASNGKYFLIKTNDNDNKTSQDYMMNDDNRAGLGGHVKQCLSIPEKKWPAIGDRG